MTDDRTRQLDELGYTIIEDAIDRASLARIHARVNELFESEGDDAGSEFKQEAGSRRLANLVNKGEVFHQVISLPIQLQCVAHVLGPKYKLSSLNARSANPRSNTTQPLHADMSAVADRHGFWVCNAVWMLDDFTMDNGPLRVVPGSHRFGRLPQDVLDDPVASHPDEIFVTGKAGTIAIINAHIWHGGMANPSDKPRTALHAFYARHDKPQQQYQKRLLDDDVQRSLSPELRQLLALDDPLNDEFGDGYGKVSGFLK